MALLIAVVAGCGGGGGGNPDPGPGPTPVIETRSVDLAAYVGASLDYAQSFSEGYVIPSVASLDRFDDLVAALLARDLDAVQQAAGASGFRVVRFVDTGAADNELYCLEELDLEGRGFYCIDFQASNTHHISAPHPLYDMNTNIEAVTVMRGTGARFLSISSTHRCSNAATSSCSGTTSACGAAGAYKVSDLAHTVDSFFYRFGKAVHDRSATTTTIQLHGCGSSACPSNNDNMDIVARLSAGTTNDLPGTALVNVLNAELNAALLALELGASLSCSEPSADKQLCGTTNTLGRYINGQPDPCQNAASDFTRSRWLHVEQNRNLRQDDGAGDSVTPATLVNAINNAL
jgi:hypothetical protein